GSSNHCPDITQRFREARVRRIKNKLFYGLPSGSLEPGRLLPLRLNQWQHKRMNTGDLFNGLGCTEDICQPFPSDSCSNAQEKTKHDAAAEHGEPLPGAPL